MLQHPDEESDRTLGERHRRDQERLEVGEGREDPVRLDAELPDETGGVGRDGADAVRVPDRVRGDDVGERPEQPPRGRAVQAGRRPPVAVHLEDQRDPPARDPARGQHRRGGVRVLGEHRVGLEAAELGRQAGRELRVEPVTARKQTEALGSGRKP